MIPMVDLQRQYRFTIRLKNRDRVMSALAENNISSAIYYPIPLHKQEAYTRRNIHSENLAASETCASEALSLPMFPELKKEELQHISNVINHAF